ncbi:hypothetical protein pb186bvf_002818 [Paramecium bursaria]
MGFIQNILLAYGGLIGMISIGSLTVCKYEQHPYCLPGMRYIPQPYDLRIIYDNLAPWIVNLLMLNGYFAILSIFFIIYHIVDIEDVSINIDSMSIHHCFVLYILTTTNKSFIMRLYMNNLQIVPNKGDSFICLDERVTQDGRFDKYNHPIDKSKQYKVTFRDEVIPQSGLVDLNIVENYKVYNIVQEREDPDCNNCLIH